MRVSERCRNGQSQISPSGPFCPASFASCRSVSEGLGPKSGSQPKPSLFWRDGQGRLPASRPFKAVSAKWQRSVISILRLQANDARWILAN